MNAAPASTRSLSIVPIVHAEADLGSMREPLKRQAQRAGGLAAWAQRQAAINAAWQRIEAWARTLDPARTPTRLFQDGLPVGEQAPRIVEDLARSGSPNHQILKLLVDRGAILTGTEAPDLLLKEYSLMQSAAAGFADEATRRRYVEQARDLLDQRDRFIASRIHETLQPGEHGLLFIGALHTPWRHLAPDITHTFPLGVPASAHR